MQQRKVQRCVQRKAEDAGGLTPAKDDNTTMGIRLCLNCCIIFGDCSKPNRRFGGAEPCRPLFLRHSVPAQPADKHPFRLPRKRAQKMLCALCVLFQGLRRGAAVLALLWADAVQALTGFQQAKMPAAP